MQSCGKCHTYEMQKDDLPGLSRNGRRERERHRQREKRKDRQIQRQ